ncbi:MAG: prephenate dehydrogenase [Solobacterium sp.]|jgi:prephenate dehydrogenase|nr:prephenate dehydrogenase [Solobacterium sp.]MCH4206597.1 prephenate dehydrogenase [Solobacterium sp.]MCH4227791.1 prephenate dehydrogenase [Solobacterium sp.]MCH4283317.1 prephenate dehydrogenase [Solobacterium sp.]
MIESDTVFAIVGLGVLGGSYIQALSKMGYKCIGIDIDEEAVQYAMKNHWIAAGGTDSSLVQKADIIVSCLYPHVFVQWVKENQKYFKAGALLSDVTGIKREIIRDINAELREDVEFIACHPMAGKEFKGIQYADAARFANANFIIVPTAENTPEAIASAHQLAEILGFTKISQLTAAEHDRMIGFLSQLTHVIAVSLMNVSDNTHLVDYTGDSFRDLTRIAKINEDMWPELFELNKDNLIREINEFSQELLRFRDLLAENDTEGMKEKMIQSTERRKKFDKS